MAALLILGCGHARAQEGQSLRVRMLAAEDARDSSPAGLAPLLEGLKDPDAETQRRAVRALGRFEQPALLTHIVPVLSATEASVRAEAANALAQAFHAEPNGAAGAVIARAALQKEAHPLVRGALLLALGRFKYTTLDDWRAAEVLLCDTLFPENAGAMRGSASPAVLLNGLRGMLFLARQAPGNRPLHQVTVAALSRLVRPPAEGATAAGATPTAGARVRLLALQVLRAGHVSDTGPFERARLDPDASVRRVAVVPITAGPLLPAGFLDMLAGAARARGQSASDVERTRKELTAKAEQGLRKQLEDDPSPTVRLEALRGYLQQETPNCALVLRRFDDVSVYVALTAIDGVATKCATDRHAHDRLARIASGSAPLKSNASWHGRAHALVALAKMDRAAALPLVRTAARDQNPWLRMYAARALGHALAPADGRTPADVDLLRSLARDAHVNVATAAIESLQATLAHDADDAYLAALARDDRATAGAATGAPTGYELVLAAVKALKDTPRVADAEAALLATLDRLTADRRETSRDPRMAILGWLSAQGSAAAAERLRAYLIDVDPPVARAAAAFISSKTGTSVQAQPRPLPRAPLPTDAELDSLETTTVELQMADGGRVAIALLPQEAPLNAFRFVKLAERRYFDGLTIHRLVANFVAQGGSPGANEYSGDGPFSRDEVGMASNADGTVGVSTRGRDTGDGQFYVNINDNTRLDHTYTVFGRIVAGREVVDRWLEGDVIVKARVVAR